MTIYIDNINDKKLVHTKDIILIEAISSVSGDLNITKFYKNNGILCPIQEITLPCNVVLNEPLTEYVKFTFIPYDDSVEEYQVAIILGDYNE